MSGQSGSCRSLEDHTKSPNNLPEKIKDSPKTATISTKEGKENMTRKTRL